MSRLSTFSSVKLQINQVVTHQHSYFDMFQTIQFKSFGLNQYSSPNQSLITLIKKFLIQMNNQNPSIKIQQPAQNNSSQTIKRNHFDLNQVADKQQWPKLKKIRLDIAKSSLQKSILRVHQQKTFSESFDQIQVQELFNQKVSQNINYQEYSSHYADTSCINKGRFSANGQLYGTVGSSGEGWIWNTKDSNDSKNFTEKITSLKSDVKLCDIAFHPKIQSIPAFAPNICTSTSNGELLFWTFDPNLQQQKSFKLKPHIDRINSVEYHQSGNYFLCSSYDTTWSLFDAAKLQQIYIQRGHQREIHCSSLHPDGSLYFTGDLGGTGEIWDLRTGKGIYEISEPDSILCCDFSQNGYELALGGKSNMITVKDIRRLKTMKQIPAHTKLVSGLKYDKNESILCSVSHDNTLKLWHGRNYISVNLQPHLHSSKLTSVDVHEGKIATTSIERKWCMWTLKNSGKNQAKLEEVEQDEEEENESQQQEQN